jgi:hypothetical protein
MEMSEDGSGVSPDSRQKTVDALCEHFANDLLTVEEFERRVDRAHQAESTEELRGLLSDLSTENLPAAEDQAATDVERARASVPSSRVKERSFIVAALGGADRKGRWIPARTNYSISVLGGTELDFREALLPPGETEVWVFSVMGGCEIVVPPGLAVESDGVAILGGFEHREEARAGDDPDAPVLVIRGFAVMGGVEVSIRYSGESARDAKRRRRQEDKERRRLGRGRRGRRGGGRR